MWYNIESRTPIQLSFRWSKIWELTMNLIQVIKLNEKETKYSLTEANRCTRLGWMWLCSCSVWVKVHLHTYTNMYCIVNIGALWVSTTRVSNQWFDASDFEAINIYALQGVLVLSQPAEYAVMSGIFPKNGFLFRLIKPVWPLHRSAADYSSYWSEFVE